MQLSDHKLHLVYVASRAGLQQPVFNLEALAAPEAFLMRPSQTVTGGAWLPEPWRPGMQGRLKGQLWEAKADPWCSTDLAPEVLSLFDGERGAAFSVPDAIWNNQVRRLLNGQGLWPEGERGDGRRALRLLFSKAARARLAEAGEQIEELQLNVESPRLLAFRTSVSLLDLPVTLQSTNQQPLTATAFAEAAHALSRINELRWIGPGDARSVPFTLGAIARTFLEGPGAEARPERRVFTAAFARLAPGAPEGAEEEVAVALAKHYNDSYRVSRDADVACQVVRPFDGIRQATAREGCAVVVRTEADSPDFIQQYYKRAFQPAYLPFALLAVHETEAWRDLARGLARWHEIDTERSRATAVAALRACRTKAVQLRLAFGFNQVSAVAAHGRWRDALDDVLELPRTRRQISEEVTAAELLIAEQHSRTTERNTRWISIIAGAGVTCATAFSVLKDVLLPSFGKEDWPLRWGLVLEPSASLAALLSIVLGGVAGTLIWWRLGRYDPPDVSTADRGDGR